MAYSARPATPTVVESSDIRQSRVRAVGGHIEFLIDRIYSSSYRISIIIHILLEPLGSSGLELERGGADEACLEAGRAVGLDPSLSTVIEQ
jgi:hypothetical protein